MKPLDSRTTLKDIRSNFMLSILFDSFMGDRYLDPFLKDEGRSLADVGCWLGDEEAVNDMVSRMNRRLIRIEDNYDLEALKGEFASKGTRFPAPIGHEVYDAFHPGELWLDDAGYPIDAHGGMVYREGDTYYWIGEGKDHTDREGHVWTYGVKCYSSKDLHNWHYEGYLLKPELEDEESPLFPIRWLDRPHLVKSKRGTYVLWIKMCDFAYYAVYESKDILGPYEERHRYLRPFGRLCGDFDIAVDEESGDGYLYFESDHEEMLVSKLSDDFLDVAGEPAYVYRHLREPYAHEAPCHFMKDGRHYLMTSSMTGYVPNPSEVVSSSSFMGPFEKVGNPHVNDVTGASFSSQVGCIFRMKDGRLIAMADRWLPDIKMTPELVDLIFRVVSSSKGGSEKVSEEERLYYESLPILKGADTALSRYVWLPIEWNEGNKPILRWRDEWSL